MKAGWKEYKISEVANVVGGGTPKTSIEEYWNGNIPWLAPKDLTGYNDVYISHGSRFITELGLKKSSAKLMPKGTVLLTSRAPIGYVAIARNTLCTNQGFKSLIPNNELCNSEFLYYWIKNNIPHLKQLGTGTTFAEISGSVLKDVTISLPQLDTQKKIAHILSTLDDKIELNRKMNETLEAIAQALFKSWFVDFDPVHARAKCKSDTELEAAAKALGISREVLELFPSEFVESEMGMIPLGWEVKNMQNIVSVKDGTHDSPKQKDEGYPLVTSKHIKNGEIELDTPKLISKEDFDKVSKRSIVEKYDILIGMIGTIGDLYLVTDDEINYAIKNIGLFKTSEVQELSEYIYYWLDTPLMRNYIILRLAGTTQKYISLTELRKLPVVLPTDDITAKYRELVGSVLSMKKLNFENSKVLTKTRDTLLPKLLSGELDVSEVKS